MLKFHFEQWMGLGQLTTFFELGMKYNNILSGGMLVGGQSKHSAAIFAQWRCIKLMPGSAMLGCIVLYTQCEDTQNKDTLCEEFSPRIRSMRVEET